MGAHVHTWKRRALFDWRYVREESRRAYRMACILFWSVLMFFFCQRYVVGMGVIAERSMLPTLSDGSYFLVNKYIYHVTRPKRREIVVLRRGAYETEEYVKRVIGLSGETLRLHAGRVYINGRLLDEPYAVGPTYPEFGPYRIEPGRYFLMGDNRAVSEDSRAFGTVPLRDIEGKISPGELFPLR